VWALMGKKCRKTLSQNWTVDPSVLSLIILESEQDIPVDETIEEVVLEMRGPLSQTVREEARSTTMTTTEVTVKVDELEPVSELDAGDEQREMVDGKII